MAIRTLLLDVGNTLVHEVPSRFEVYAEAARRRGAGLDEGAMRELMVDAHRALPQVIDGAFRYSDPWFEHYIGRIFHTELGIDAAELEAIRGELFARFEDPRTFRLFPGALELIEELGGRGVQLGIVSNWSARLPRLLDALGLTPHFPVVLCSAIERLEKPQPEIFELAMERLGARPEETLHAGDHPVNDGAASRVGIGAVLVDREGAHADAEHPRVRDLAELLAFVTDRLETGP
jgi:putative hydrolase of the HAD superfamily